ncbi:MAG TPA: hypothetical protein VL728_09520 [Cyclobacteriaceae bacterium]|nr:hypothetical protein [Cyclobacteriaceae bacterium]
MTRALTLLLSCICLLAACSTQRMICPAYQSSFYFDKSKQKEAFFFYNENKNQPREVLASNSKTLNLPPNDSSWAQSHVVQGPALPFERKQKKEKYLLLPRKTYKQALRQLQTVPMKPVYPKLGEDTTDIRKELDSAARSVTDTITTVASAATPEQQEDSVYVITKEKEKFNLDQDNYMWYFRDVLVLPDVKQGMEAATEEKNADRAGTTATKTKQSFFSKLKGLFKKKPKHKADSTELKTVEPPEENYDTEVDSTARSQQPPLLPATSETKAAVRPANQPKAKKGLFGKKKAKVVTAPPVKKPEAKKDEKDGFE